MGVVRAVDYLVVGAGAMSIAFVDEIVRQDKSASVAIVDRRTHPGGHWNDAYDFVTLHQPAVAYGVNSSELAKNATDLASKPQILNYYREVMAGLIATRRVQFFGGYEFVGNQTIVGDTKVTFDVRRRLVDGTYLEAEIPATHSPNFDVAPTARLRTPNQLSGLETSGRTLYILGGGKTAIDTVLYLASRGIKPSHLFWIIPNDMWMWNRYAVRPGNVVQEVLSHATALDGCASISEAFAELERAGSVFRFDQNVQPSKWRCAIVSPQEFDQAKSAAQILRRGRVAFVGRSEIVFQDGRRLELLPNAVVVDCTANGLRQREPKPIFEPGQITLQSMLMCQQVFSAALIARIEAQTRRINGATDEALNRKWKAVCLPVHQEDLSANVLFSIENMREMTLTFPLWARRSRLNLAGYGALHSYCWQLLKALWVLFKTKKKLRVLVQESQVNVGN